MKLWLIERTGGGDWDETDAIVVRAEDLAAAKAQALATEDRVNSVTGHHDAIYRGFTADNIQITELTPEGEPGLILGSWNWG